MIRYLDLFRSGEDGYPRLCEDLVDNLEVRRHIAVGFLHGRDRFLVVLSDPLVERFSIGAISLIQLLISLLDAPCHVRSVFYLCLIPGNLL